MARASSKKKQQAWYNRFSGRQLMAAFIICAFAVAGVLGTAFSRAATSATGPIYGIGGNCIDNLDAKPMNANTISLWHCDGTAAQNWTVPGDGTLRNQGYCLDVQYGGKTSKTPVWLWKCNGTGAQQWKVKGKTLVNPQSGLCLDDKSAKTTDGNPIWIYTCNGTAAQNWTLPSANPQTPAPPTTPTNPTPPNPQQPGSGNNPSGQPVPGAVSGWKLIFADDFTGTVPLGAFSDCNNSVNTPQATCGGLKKYSDYYANWWAYPSNWDDTAKSKVDGNTQAPYGGTYHPEDVVSVNNGAMHINMFRPKTGGDIHSATLIPKKCMVKKYGRYTERFKVVHMEPGFKSAHEFYENRYEMDFPEGDWSKSISGFAHRNDTQVMNIQTGKSWTEWHTSTIEWAQNSLKYYLDGKLVGSITTNVANFPMSWFLQNESSIEGPYAKAGASAQMDIDWVACYSQS